MTSVWQQHRQPQSFNVTIHSGHDDTHPRTIEETHASVRTIRSCDFFRCRRNRGRSSILIYFYDGWLIVSLNNWWNAHNVWDAIDRERERERKSACCAIKISFLHFLPLAATSISEERKKRKPFPSRNCFGFYFFLLFFFQLSMAFLRLHSTGRTRNSCCMKLI